MTLTRPRAWTSQPARIAITLAALATVGAGCGSASKSTTATTTSSGASGGPTSLSADTVTSTSVTLTGSGASSINPFFERVFYDYHQANSKTTVQYSPAGSSVGIKDIQQNVVNFGDSEIPMTSSELAQATAGTILQIPVDLGGVAISYNVPGAPKTLDLDGPTLAGIFDGTITKWNAPQIASVSGVSNLPDLPIIPVHRADASGPGWDLDAYLIKTAPAWTAKTGATKPSKTWPLATIGIGQQLNTGVANYVHQTPGAIGFVEYAYALQAGFDNASLKNQSGSFVAPSIQSITAAGAQATNLSATNFSIIDEQGSGTYPLANFSWTLLYQKQANEAKGEALGKLFHYVVTTGQTVAPSLGYAPMPANAVSLSQNALDADADVDRVSPLHLVTSVATDAAATEVRPLVVPGVRDALRRRRPRRPSVYPWLYWTAAAIFAAVVIALVVAIAAGSAEAFAHSGLSFIWSTTWDPADNEYAAGTLIVGTVITTGVAMVLAVPVGLGIAVYLSELSPGWLAAPLGGAIEFLAAVPSIIVGLWALLVLSPVFAQHVEPFLSGVPGLGWLFKGPSYGPSILLASVVLAVMVLPTMVALSRTALAGVERTDREAAVAMGATRWQVIRTAVLPGAGSGIAAAITLAVGRALGEAIAVAMVIGNRPTIPHSLLAPGATLGSAIVNQFAEASPGLATSSVIALGAVLLLLTVAVNFAGQKLLRRRSSPDKTLPPGPPAVTGDAVGLHVTADETGASPGSSSGAPKAWRHGARWWGTPRAARSPGADGQGALVRSSASSR